MMFRMLLVVLIIAVALVVSCSAPASPSGAPSTSATPTSSSSASTTPAAQNPASEAKSTNLVDLLPAGNGKEQFLSNCATCHTVICAVKGQRAVSRWTALKSDHRDKVQGLSQPDYDALFSYLSQNFNDSKPEPQLPPQLAQQGSCAPY